MRKLFDEDPITRTRRIFHGAPDGSFTIETQQEVDDILEVNKAIHVQHDERARWGGDGLGARVASIPQNIWCELERLGIINDDKAFRRWLDDPVNSKFRVRPGLLSR